MQALDNVQLTSAVNAVLNGLQALAEALSAALPAESMQIIESHLLTTANRMAASGQEHDAFVCREIARAIAAGTKH